MTGWVGNIEEATLGNTNFRTVLFTGTAMQLTVMRLGPGEESGVEMHDHRDQFIRGVRGSPLAPSGTASRRLTTSRTTGW